MPISFLNPWFWLGALAAAAPIWLHLRRRRRTDLYRFSAVRFLEDQPEPRRSPLRLRHWLLFLLRLLALLLIIAGFAWPYLRRADTLPIKESRVYILDNTLSHQANGGFARDRDHLLNELGRAGDSLQVAVVELTSAPRVVAAFGDDRATARQRVADLRPSHQRGSYLAAFRQAGSLLANSLGREKRLILLGDNQQNQWNEQINTPPFLHNVQVELPKLAAPALPNLSLSEPRAQRIFLGDKSLINFTVKLSHVGEARSANVILRVNDQIIFNRPLDLDKQPETVLLQAQWEADPATWLRGEAVVEGQPDALAQDNRVFFSVPPVLEGHVALLAQSPYLRLALSPEIMRGEWATRVVEPAGLSAELAADHDADVLCIESNYLQSGDARKLVWRYLSNGRGVFLLINHLTPTVKGALRELGFEVNETAEAADKKGGSLQFVSFSHPIFHPFLSPDFGNLTEIRFSSVVTLKPTESMPLLFSEQGPVFSQGTKFPGKLFVAGFGLDREHTSWPVHQSFIPFLDLTLQTARAGDTTPTTFEPGEQTVIQLPSTVGAREVVLRDSTHELARSPVDKGRAQLRLPDEPGLYTVTYDENQTIEKMLSVNPSAKESELLYVSGAEAVKVWRIDNPAGTSPRAAAIENRMSLRGILRQRLWWWMVVGALGALFLEIVLAGVRWERT